MPDQPPRAPATRPLQNRVDPFSTLHAVAARGLFTGNRGILHDPATRTLKHQRWTSESWVICVLTPKTGHKTAPGVMRPNHWTELFFLDEAVGLAAGHRPCHGCRKPAARAFRQALGLARVSDLNALINAEMKGYLRARAPLPHPRCDPHGLPDGAFFAIGGQAFLKWRGTPVWLRGLRQPPRPSVRRSAPHTASHLPRPGQRIHARAPPLAWLTIRNTALGGHGAAA